MSKRKQANKKQYSGDGEYSDLQDNASMDSEDVTYSDVNKPRPAKSSSTNPNNLKLVLKIGQVKNEGGLDQTVDSNAMNPPLYPATEPPGAKMTENPLKIKIRLSGGGRDAMTGAPLLPPHTGTPSKGKRTRPGEHESDDMALDEEHVTPVQPRGRGRPSSRQNNKRKREEGVGTPQSPASSYQTGVDEDEDSDSDFENRSQSSSHLLDQSGLIGVEGLDTFNMPHSRGRGKKNDRKAGAPGTPATPQGPGSAGNTQSTKKKQQPKTRSSTRKKQKKKQPSSPTSGGQEAGYGSYDSDPENLDAPHPYYCTPPNFWKNLEPYFQDLTQADIDALMPKNDGIDPDDVYFQLPALGSHYKDVWQEEDEKGIDTSYGRQSSRLTTSRGQFGDMGHDEGLDGFGDNSMLAQGKDHFAEEEPVRCENFTSRILSAMLEEHLTLPGYGQSPLNKKAMDGRQNPFNRSGTMPLNRSASGYGSDVFGGDYENGGYGAPNYPNNPLGLAIPLGIAPVEGYSYQSQLLLNEKIKQELMNLGLDLSEPEPPPSSAPVVSAQPTATPVEVGEDDEILQELKKLQQQLREQLTINVANNKRLAQLAVPKLHEQSEAKKKAEEVAALEQVLLSKITTRRGKKRPGRKTNTSAAAAASASKKNTSTSTSEPANNTPAQ